MRSLRRILLLDATWTIRRRALGAMIAACLWTAVPAQADTAAPDTTFGTNGLVSGGPPWSAMQQVSGVMTVAGGSGRKVVVARFDAGGTPTASFGSGTHYDSSTPSSSTVTVSSFGTRVGAVVVAPDNSVYVIGTANDGSLASPNDKGFVAHFLATGAVDTAYGGAGTGVARFSSINLPTMDLAAGVLDSSGRLLVAGTEGTGGEYNSGILMRLTTAGALDPTFNTTNHGWVRFNDADTDETILDAIALDSSDNILVAGSRLRSTAGTNPLPVDFFVGRVTSAGVLDSTFGSGGSEFVILGGLTGATPHVANVTRIGFSDGLIVLGGNLQEGTRHEISFVPLQSSGAASGASISAGNADSTFDLSPDHVMSLADMAMRPDLGITYVGQVSVGGTDEFLMGSVAKKIYAPGVRGPYRYVTDDAFNPGAMPPSAAFEQEGSHGDAFASALAFSATDHPILAGGADGLGAIARFGGNGKVPVASLIVSPAPQPGKPVRPGQTVHFDGSGSSDADGHIVSYQWDVDGATISDTTSRLDMSFAEGDHSIGLTVTDDDGLHAHTGTTLAVHSNLPPSTPVVTAKSSTSDPTVRVGVLAFLTVHSDDADGKIVDYKWDLDNDGSYETDGDPQDNGAESRVFATAGPYSGHVEAIDDDGGVTQTAFTVNVAAGPCKDGVTAFGRVRIAPTTETTDQATCLHKDSQIDNKDKTTRTLTYSAATPLLVNGILVTPNGQARTSIHVVEALTNGAPGALKSMTLKSSSATVTAQAANAPATFFSGKLDWDLSGDRIVNFSIASNATLGGMKLSVDTTKYPTLDKAGTATIGLTPHLPTNLSPAAATPDKPRMVTFAISGQGATSRVAPMDLGAHAADNSDPCGKKAPNGGFDFCVKAIPLGVMQIDYLHVYYAPLADGNDLWGAEAAVTVNAGPGGPLSVGGGMEFLSQPGQGPQFHAAYLEAQGHPDIVTTGVFQFRSIKFQINMGPDFAATFLKGASINAPGSDSPSPSGTCVPHVGVWNLFNGHPIPDHNDIYGHPYPDGGIEPFYNYLNETETISGEPAGKWIREHYPKSPFVDPYPVDYGTPDLALCGEVGFGILEVADITAGFGYAEYPKQAVFPQPVSVFWFDGKATILNLIKAEVDGEFWSDGYVKMGVSVNVAVSDWLKVNGYVTLEAWKQQFNAEGGADVTIPPIGLELGVQMLVSSRGIAGCGIVHFIGKWAVGAGALWHHDPDFMLSGCDVGPYRDAIDHPSITRVAGDQGPLAQVSAAPRGDTFVVPKGTPGFSLALPGSGGEPHAIITDPTGRVYDTGPGPDPVKQDGFLAVHWDKIDQSKADTPTTEVAISDPVPGTWKITPALGSAPYTKVLYGGGLQPPTGKAFVTGRGAKRLLHYTLRGVAPDETVTFQEDGQGGSTIATLKPMKATAAAVSTAGATVKGTVRFLPGVGETTVRNLNAIVTDASGLPRANITIGTYKPPAPSGPARVSRVRLVHRHGKLTITWAQPRNGIATAGYMVSVRLSDGRSLSFLPRIRKVVVPAVAPEARVTVRILGESPVHIAGRVRTVRAKLRS